MYFLTETLADTIQKRPKTTSLILF